jgi:hypothetical protein
LAGSRSGIINAENLILGRFWKQILYEVQRRSGIKMRVILTTPVTESKGIAS